MMNLITDKRKKILYVALLTAIFLLAIGIRFHNLSAYNTLWADDGGGHIIYTETLIHQHRLPTDAETYLAWHEPLYYGLLAGWDLLNFFDFTSLDWWESFNIIVYLVFLVLVWLLTLSYSQRNYWLALLNVFIFAILFIGVKLSAYVNNELLLQTLILLLIWLFRKFDLEKSGAEKKVFWWSIILALALLTKITAWIVLLAAFLFWLWRWWSTRHGGYFKYILISLVVCVLINIPWLIYKQQTFGTYFSINPYEAKPKQSLIASDAWSYIFKVNTKIFKDYPYWFSQPHSYASILLSDSFGDYYNLFNDYVIMQTLPPAEKILVGNGRYTTPHLFKTMIEVNRIAFVLTLFWLIGLAAYFYQIIRRRKIENYDVWLLVLLFGGWLASLYHNIRLPYLEAGVLKGHFIYFTYPLLSLLAYRQWQALIKNPFLKILIIWLPWCLYLYLAQDILLVNWRL